MGKEDLFIVCFTTKWNGIVNYRYLPDYAYLKK